MGGGACAGGAPSAARRAALDVSAQLIWLRCQGACACETLRLIDFMYGSPWRFDVWSAAGARGMCELHG